MVQSARFVVSEWVIMRRFLALIGVLLAGCNLIDTLAPTAAPTSTPVPLAGVTMIAPTETYSWRDARDTISGVCFEAALALAGQPFVLNSGEEHIRFYDQIDGLQACRRAITRVPFDFTTGAVLAGLWSAGTGCTADHEVLAVERDDSARTLTIRLRFVTAGDCPYELVRPFWIALDDVTGYAITLVVE
jgi:hypothetical protein